MPGEQRFVEHVALQHAESTTAIDGWSGVIRWVTEDHDVILKVRAMDTGKVVLVDRSGQIQANDCSTDSAAERMDIEDLWRNGLACRDGRHK